MTFHGWEAMPRRKLARREQEALEVLHRLAPCTAAQLQESLGGTYSGARALLARLVAKGLAVHSYDGPRYIYRPAEESTSAGKSALREIVDTFFQGSNAEAIGALLALSKDAVDQDELKRLEDVVAAARAAATQGSGDDV